MRCLIIEDEPIARNILKGYIEDVPHLELAGECEDALEALEFLKNESVELLFLDINMPKLSGISFLKTLNNPPAVILTTAYAEFALESYDLGVIDYLLKPFSFERFLKAVQKVAQVSKPTLPNKTEGFLIVKCDGKTYNLKHSSIYYAESKGDYITLVTEEHTLTFNKTMKGLEEELGGHSFQRVHKSYLVNMEHVRFVEGNIIHIHTKEIPIGNHYKESFMNAFSRQ